MARHWLELVARRAMIPYADDHIMVRVRAILLRRDIEAPANA